MKLLFENYNTEEYLIKNMKRESISLSKYNRSIDDKYEIEDQLTEDQKLEIFNSHTNDLGDYLLEKIALYLDDTENDTIKRGKYDDLNKNSLNKWLKLNDPRHIFNLRYDRNYLTYHLKGTEFRMSLTTPNHTGYVGGPMLWTDKNIINEWFHLLLKELEKTEELYYRQNDITQIKCTRLKELSNKYYELLGGTFSDIDNELRKKEPDSEKINRYLEMMIKLDQKIQDAVDSILTEMTIK